MGDYGHNPVSETVRALAVGLLHPALNTVLRPREGYRMNSPLEPRDVHRTLYVTLLLCEAGAYGTHSFLASAPRWSI